MLSFLFADFLFVIWLSSIHYKFVIHLQYIETKVGIYHLESVLCQLTNLIYELKMW